ncbi:DNA mismatch repair protein MutL [Spirochaetia bacterium]|nr:DNA mismatch repair protein MutL [Spirochaetia bacterium]
MRADPAVTERRRIQLLPPEEARKIAAGEVIDRPAALVREFLDNAIDAGGSSIELTIDEGGIRRVEVSDDGCGMDREDLELCWQTHATSKIRSLDDLNSAETLGFRGEALAAVAAVSRLEILTSTDGREAWGLKVGPGGSAPPRIEQSRRARGTSVRAWGLFDTIPARKRFLKREGSEAGLCKQIFIDKAMAFPLIQFRFIQDRQLKVFLPPASSLKERYAAALLDRKEGAFLHEIACTGQGFSVVIVAGGPELYRQDRRQQYVFANGRRIQDYSLLQALEYGVQGWFPNGTHPVGAVYVDIDPALADFNIHPAKREVRFRDAGAIHHAITAALRDFTRRVYAGNNAALAEERNGEEPNYDELFRGPEYQRDGGHYHGNTPSGYQNNALRGGGTSREPAFAGYHPDRHIAALSMEALLENPPDFIPPPGRGPETGDRFAAEAAPPYGDFEIGENAQTVYLGRLFGLFLLVQRGDKLFIIDQHAAHERILYDRFLAGPIPTQELLVPIPFTTEDAEDDRFLSEQREELAKLGLGIEGDAGSWRITALPTAWRLTDSETVREILNLRQARENIAEHWAATLSCHGAIKDGSYLDAGTAAALVEAALRLPAPRCPHGRPIWKVISREELLRAVRRL